LCGVGVDLSGFHLWIRCLKRLRSSDFRADGFADRGGAAESWFELNTYSSRIFAFPAFI
jgi:hypothetical protein